MRGQGQWGRVGERLGKGHEARPSGRWILRLLYLNRRSHAPHPCSLAFPHYCEGLYRAGNSEGTTQKAIRRPSSAGIQPLPSPVPHARACRGRPGHTQGLGQQLLSLQLPICRHCQAPFCRARACLPPLQGRGRRRRAWATGAGFCEDLGRGALPAPNPLPAPKTEAHTPVPTAIRSFL